MTRDISEVGLFVVSQACPPLRSKVDVEILFGRSKSNVSLRGSMQVLRVEADLNRICVCGFALSGKRLSVGGAAQA